VHVFRCILQHSISHVMILYRVDRKRLEASPTQWKYQWILILQNPFMPTVLL